MSQYFSPSANLLSRCLPGPAVETNTEATQGEAEAQSHFPSQPSNSILNCSSSQNRVWRALVTSKWDTAIKEETEEGRYVIGSDSLLLTLKRCGLMFFLTAEPAAMTSAAVLVCRLRCFRHLFEIVHGHMKLKRHRWMWPDNPTAGPREMTQVCTSV